MRLFRNKKHDPKKMFKAIELLNMRTYWYYYNMLSEIYLNLIEYDNLPESMNGEFIEEVLFYHTGISFFEEEVYDGVVHLPFNQLGKPDIYDYPVKIMAYSDTGYNRRLKRNEFEVMYTNSTRTIPFEAITLFAYRLAEIERTLDVNLENQKNPKIILADESQKLTLDNMMMKVKGNYPYIPVKKDIDVKSFDQLDLTVPYVGDKLDIHKHNIINDFLTFCGVENGTRDKKQSMTNDEVNANWGNVEACRNTRLKSRKRGIERVNRKWGYDIQVRFNSDLPTLLNRQNMEDKGLGSLYDHIVGTSLNNE